MNIMLLPFSNRFCRIGEVRNIRSIFSSNFQHFYIPEYVTNKEVRKSWFYFAFYFLPICNKDWKDHIQMDRLNKTEIIYRQVTTSDEAIVNFFLQLWAPKIQIEKDSKWTMNPVSTTRLEVRPRPSYRRSGTRTSEAGAAASARLSFSQT